MNKTYGWLILILFLIWSVLSWRWYTCEIKGFCSDSSKESFVPQKKVQVPVEVKEEPSIDVLIPASGETVEVIQEEEGLVVEVTQEEPIVCVDLLTTNIGPNRTNNADEVTDLQRFLNDQEGENLSVDGSYSDDDVKAVNRFQLKYSAEILDPLNLSGPTGNVFGSTRSHVNELFCNN